MMRTRDYSTEYKRRIERQRRLLVDMDREKVEAFLKHLQAKNLTYAKWINEQIDKEMGI